MNSAHHALHAAVLAIVLSAVVPPPVHPLLVVPVVVGIGVGIDVDHFLIARLKRGSWANLRSVLDEPSKVLFDQPSIFDDGDVGPIDRLASHGFIATVATSLLLVAGSTYWAGVVMLTILVHLAADGYSTATNRRATRAGARADG